MLEFDFQIQRNALAVALSTIFAAAAWKISGSLIRNYFVGKFTCVKDLQKAGQARPDEERIRGTAVICGGGIAGLWTARICADHFEDVLIIEPEVWLATKEGVSPVYDKDGDKHQDSKSVNRTRVSQYFGLHYLQFFSVKALRHLFPSFDEETYKRHGRIGEADCGIGTCMGDFFRSPKVSYPNGGCPEVLFSSREGYERMLRFLVFDSSNRIRHMTGTVTTLRTGDLDKAKVKSVVVNPPDGKSAEIQCALVADCTGASQAGFKWIKRLNAGPTGGSEHNYDQLVESYDAHTRWRNFVFPIPPERRSKLPIPGGYDSVGGMFWAFFPFPGRENRYIAFDRLEGHRIRIALYRWGSSEMPEKIEEIKDYLLSINTDRPIPNWTYDLIDQLLDLKDDMIVISSSKLPPFNWIHFERASFVPSNFVAIGDSVMRVNPCFAQGCTKAAVGAITLDSLLRSRSMIHDRSIPSYFSSKFFKLQCDKIADAWNLTKPMDYMFDTTTPSGGRKNGSDKLNGELSLLLFELCTKDVEVDSVAVHIRQFIAPATDVYAPWMLWRILKFAVQKRLGLA